LLGQVGGIVGNKGDNACLETDLVFVLAPINAEDTGEN